MHAILTVTDLTKRYGDKVAVNAISFAVRPREIVGLLGPNGAGKTTTINMVLGVLAPNVGSITINGIDLAKHPSKAKSEANFAAVYAPLPGNLTVLQNLRVFGMMYGVKNLGARIETVITDYQLSAYRHTKCGLLSSGEQTRVALAKAMLNQPALLLLDEPTASLDPATARDLRRQIRAQTSAGTGGVLWTSHNMAEVEEVCDRVLFLSHGKCCWRATPKPCPPPMAWPRWRIYSFALRANRWQRQSYENPARLCHHLPLFQLAAQQPAARAWPVYLDADRHGAVGVLQHLSKPAGAQWV